jgi:hypothetical protein
MSSVSWGFRSARAELVRAAAARAQTGMPTSAAMSLRLRWRYSFLAYLGRLMATRGMNRSSTIARIRSAGIGL